MAQFLPLSLGRGTLLILHAVSTKPSGHCLHCDVKSGHMCMYVCVIACMHAWMFMYVCMLYTLS